MATTIQIKRSPNVTAATTTDLLEGELAYSYDKSGEGAGAKLYIEVQDSAGNETIHTIGGKYYTAKVDAATNLSTGSTIVSRDSLGNFSAGNISARLFGTANTATIANSATIANTANTFTTARTITLGGDLSGNVSFNGSQDVTLTATITNSGGTISSFARSGNTFTITETGNTFSASIAGSDIPVGLATQGNLISNAVTLTVGSTMANSIAQLNQVLGKLVPASPPSFPSGSNTLTMSSSTTSSRMSDGFAQFYNTSANTTVAAGTTIAARRAAAYVTSTIPDSGPGDSGTLTLYLNDTSAGSRTFTTGSDNGTYGANLVIADNVDYATKTGAASGF